MTPIHRRGESEKAANSESQTAPLVESVEHGPLPEVDLVGEPCKFKAPISRAQVEESIRVRGRELEKATECPVERHVERVEVLGRIGRYRPPLQGC